jgi:hypothetical protein
MKTWRMREHFGVGIFQRLDALDRWAGASPPSRSHSYGRPWLRYGVGCLFVVLFLAYGVLTAWNSRHDLQVADRLGRDGDQVQGQIIDYRVPHQLKGAHEVKVSFGTLTGQHVETWVTVSKYRSPGPTQVRYLKSDPSVARLVDDLEPRAGDLLALIIIVFGLGALAFMVFRIGKGFDRRLGVGE